MNSKMIWANLVSNDLKKTTEFYTQLGFKPNCNPTEELASFSFGKDNFVINFFVKKRFEFSIKGKSVDLKNENEIIFSLSADSREDVDRWLEKVKEAGGTIFSEPENFEKGILLVLQIRMVTSSIFYSGPECNRINNRKHERN